MLAYIKYFEAESWTGLAIALTMYDSHHKYFQIGEQFPLTEDGIPDEDACEAFFNKWMEVVAKEKYRRNGIPASQQVSNIQVMIKNYALPCFYQFFQSLPPTVTATSINAAIFWNRDPVAEGYKVLLAEQDRRNRLTTRLSAHIDLLLDG